jgi:hypothetical protein
MSDSLPPVPGREPITDARTNKINRVWFMFFDNINSVLKSIIGSITDINVAITDINETITELDTEKQDLLVSGTNIKTIMGSSVLGSGDLVIDIPPVVTARTSSFTETTLKGRVISICDAATGNITVTLPDCATCSGMYYTAKKIDASANTVTLDPNGAQTIDGVSTAVISVQYTSVTIFSNGSTWYKI